MNRKLIGQIAELHFAPTPRNSENLKRENICVGVYICGNTVVDAIHMTVKPDYKFKDKSLNKLDFENNRVVLVTAHRRGKLWRANGKYLYAILELANKYTDVHFVYPVHLSPYVRETSEKILGGHIEYILSHRFQLMKCII